MWEVEWGGVTHFTFCPNANSIEQLQMMLAIVVPVEVAIAGTAASDLFVVVVGVADSDYVACLTLHVKQIVLRA